MWLSGIPTRVVLLLAVTCPVAAAETAPFHLPALPFKDTDLEPYISSGTLKFHHGKHHAKYIATTNQLLEGSSNSKDLKKLTLKDLVVEAHRRGDTGLFNNAAQSWNHAFYWNGMKRGGGGTPPAGVLLDKIQESFGSFPKFATAFKDAGNTAFGSGWAWLVYQEGTLQVTKTIGAENPMTSPGGVPLLCMDVWEHAYYLDYQNMRTDYVDDFLGSLVNWDFVAANLQEAMKATKRGAEL